jgi:hypothetical protein
MTDTTQPNVRPLVPRDRFRTSAEPIVRLYIALGDAGAERTICSALDDLALRLSRIELSLKDCQYDDALQDCRRMAAVAEQIGLTEITIAADHLFGAAKSSSGHVGAAILARLRRATDRAMGEVWTLRHRRPWPDNENG